MDEFKKRLDDLEKRVAHLEAQSQQPKASPLDQIRAAVKEALQSLHEGGQYV